MPPADLIAPVLLGSEQRLFGIHTRVAGGRLPTALITLTAGMLPSPGPFRMYLDTARRVAELGFESVRLDQSGKGESPPREGCAPEEAILRDYDDAFSHLRDGGAQSTVLLGLCSGAVDALRIAAQRDSVAGLVLLDGYFEQTLRSQLHILAERLFSKEAWARRLRLDDPARPTRDSDLLLEDLRDWRGLKDLHNQYDACLGRGVRMLCVFSGGMYRYRYEGQLAERIGPATEHGSFEEIFYSDADHVYTAVAHRRRLVETIATWLATHFA